MKKFSLFTIISCYFLTTLVLTNCKKEEDKEDPVITNVKIGENNEAVLNTGATIYFEFDASDNQELSSYQLRIFKGTKGDPPANDGWDYSKTWSISNKKDASIENWDIQVPNDAETGNYNFRITLFDESGNSSFFEQIVPLTD